MSSQETTNGRARWAALFADLEARLDALAAVERAGEVAERARIESAGVSLAERLAGSLGQTLRIRCLPSARVVGAVRRVGPDWVLIDDGAREAVVRTAAIVTITGLTRVVAAPDQVTARLGLRHVLRGLARDRAGLRIDLVDGTAVSATVDRVAADHVDIAVHPIGEARRRGEVRERAAVPVSAISVIRRDVG